MAELSWAGGVQFFPYYPFDLIAIRESLQTMKVLNPHIELVLRCIFHELSRFRNEMQAERIMKNAGESVSISNWYRSVIGDLYCASDTAASSDAFLVRGYATSFLSEARYSYISLCLPPIWSSLRTMTSNAHILRKEDDLDIHVNIPADMRELTYQRAVYCLVRSVGSELLISLSSPGKGKGSSDAFRPRKILS